MLGLEHDFRIVDTRATLDPDESSVATHGRDISPERLEREMLQAGIVRAVASPGQRAAGRSYLRANNAVARLSIDRPFVAFARLNGPRDPGTGPVSAVRNLRAERGDHHARPDDVEQYSYDDRFHGFTLAPHVDGLPNEDVLTRLEDADLPLFVYAGRKFPPEAVETELLDYDLPVVLGSFGGYPLDADLMNETLDLLDEYDRVYVDTSAVRYREVLERGVLEHPDRVLFGSGAPDVHPNVGVMEVLTLDVSEDLMRRVLAKNPARLVPALAEGADV
ncbi:MULTISPECIES: amidohydrolase family protein [Halorubrum]|uniref:Amidohydrolase n=1 Tax=Halorubrum ezzemoulense TaxID=337243 RepID=A0A256K7U6_HALEZ|nr:MULTISPECIES: amidohydrolase family protein [Halorubrum]OYR76527.1 amidohydrolase [Halorubrum ezzemoulense]OYR81219.1 amidohydrolase [Halorubrum ezzemoulense]PHQ43443.1 amidohydrolase [Halorubrum sp. C191]QAY19435.1 amidohydrolase [Halorubrum ezzemoulense]